MKEPLIHSELSESIIGAAMTVLNKLDRRLRAGIGDLDLATTVVELRSQGRLCVVHEEDEAQEPRIICSLGLRSG